MKKLLIIIFLTVFLGSCRKGEDDPFISFKSRQNRLEGTWTLTDLEYFFAAENNGNIVLTSGNLSDGILSYSAQGTLTEKNYSLELKINKDGTFTASETTDNKRKKVSGFWTFKDSGKNKVFLEFSTDITKEFSAGSTFYIKRLSEKELTLYYYNSTSFEEETANGSKSTELFLYFQKSK